MSSNSFKQKEIKIDGLLPYLLYVPKHLEPPYPILFFLHGWGERGSDLQLLKATGLPKHLEEKDIDFLVISPQCPINSAIDKDDKESGWWATED